MAIEEKELTDEMVRLSREKLSVAIPLMDVAGVVIAQMITADQRAGIVMGILQHALSNMEDGAAEDLILKVQKMCTLYLAEGRFSEYHKKP